MTQDEQNDVDFDVESTLNTALFLEDAKNNKPLVYKVLHSLELLDETISPQVMCEIIYGIQFALLGNKEYKEFINFSIFEVDEIESLIGETKTIIKRMFDSENKVAEFARKDYQEMKNDLENHVKFLEDLISKKKQKQ